MAVCKCDTGIVNSGIPSCVSGFERIVKLFFVYQITSDGSSNAVPCSQTIDETFLTQKLNESDPSKRWYPTDKINSVEEVRNTPTTETIDNIDLNVTQGTRTFQGVFIGKASSSPQYLKFLKSTECPKVMYFGVDKNGTLVGIETEVGGEAALNGIAIQEKSIYSLPIPATATTIAKNQLNFIVDELVLDEEIGYISADEITADLLNANGLLDVTLVQNTGTSPTSTSVVVDGSLVYGSVCKKLTYNGATTPANWLVNNITTPAVITVTTVTENPNGTYTLEFAAQAASDEITVKVANNGFASNVLTIQLP